MYLFYLYNRGDVLSELVRLQNYENQFLPNALRKFFNETHPPNERSDYLSQLVDQFSERFVQCNPGLGFSKGTCKMLFLLPEIIFLFTAGATSMRLLNFHI